MSTSPTASPLATFVRDQAAWRRGQAQKFPDDHRNRRSAEALEDLASAIDQLRPGDPVLLELARLDIYDEKGALHIGPSAYRLVSRYGFDRQPDARAFLQLLLAAIADDRRNVDAGAWSVGADNSWRFEYPKGNVVVTYKGESADVLEAVVRASGAPEFKQRRDGSWDVVIPTHFESETTRFRIRSRGPMSTRTFDKWVGINDTDDVPRAVAPPPEAPDARWPESELDGGDTYQWEYAPKEPGVAAKFELSVRDAANAFGHYYHIEGSSLVDVVVALEELPGLATSRWVRVVRCALREGATTREARGIAIRAYIERCARQGRAPSGWTLRLEPNYWGGMSFDQLALIAGEPGEIGRAAEKELRERGFFYDRLTGRWVEDRPDLSIRVPSAPIKRGQPVPWGAGGPTKQLISPPLDLLPFLRRAYEKRRYLRHGGKYWVIDAFSKGFPPDAVSLVEATPPAGIEVLDFDRAGSWRPMRRDDLASGTVRCEACSNAISEANAVPVRAATGEPGAVLTCPRCDNQWLALLDRP